MRKAGIHKMKLDRIAVGIRLKEFAKTKGGVGKLAKLLDMSINTLSGGYISGRNLSGAEVLAGLLELGCDTQWLLTGQSNPKMITIDNSLIDNVTIHEDGKRDLIKKEIAERLNECLEMIKKRELKKDVDIAKTLDMKPQLLFTYKDGKSIPGGDILRKFASLGLDVNYILTGKTREKPVIAQSSLANNSPIQGEGTITMDTTVELEVLREKVKFLEDKSKLLEAHIADLHRQNNYLLNQLTKTDN
jgi:hypothetical protein